MKHAYDLIVVGTGFASTFFLFQYLRKARRNARVLVLERGNLVTTSDRRKALMTSESPSSKLSPEQDSFINANTEKDWSFTLGFGGSSNCWYACTPRFMPSDFRMKTLYGIAQDWPVQYDELEPYYTKVEQLMNVSGPETTPFPKSTPYPLPPHRFSTVDHVMKRRYGDLYIQQPTARASQTVKGRNVCCANAVCAVCPVDAKFTIENSQMNVYSDPRVQVLYGAQVHSLDLSGNIARSTQYIKGGKEYSAEGELIALGANAIFNAHILLNSNDRNPFTGKGLGEQLGLDVVVNLRALDNVGGSTWVTANGYMLYEGDHRRESAACLIESNNAPFLRIERGKWRHMATFRTIFEDLPREENEVQKGSDPLIPVVQFRGYSDYALKGIDRMRQQIGSVLSCLPVEDLEFRKPFKTEAHILGTTRMSRDETTGVVDKNLLHHHYRNLFVLGSGSFTTFSPNNPTLTLSALSMMAADRTL